jgi:Tol biopolymer transport system component
MKTVRMTLIIILLLVVLTSCSMPTLTAPGGEVNVENEIATAVAATNIASGQIAQPPASVNSLLVMYTDGEGNLRAWSSEGGIRQLTTQGNIQYIVISPDGTQVAFVRAQDYRDYSIWVMGVDGANERQLVTADDFRGMLVAEDALGAAPVQLEWVPGTHTLAFNTYPYFEGPGFFPHDDLWLVDADTGTLLPFLDIGTGGMFAYSPNGSRLAVSSFQSVSLMDGNGGNRRDDVLIYEPVMTYSEFLYYVTPQWSPDGSFLRAIVPPGDPLAQPSPPTTIWHIPGDGSAASQIASLDIAFLAVARLSPDLNRIMYVTPVTTSMPSLHIANVDGSQDMLYSSDVSALESWSPDGDRFLFTSGETNQTLIGRVGENPAPLTEFETIMKILWIDPQYFLFLRPSDAGFELRLGQVNGQSVVLDTLQSEQEFWIPVIDVYP